MQITAKEIDYTQINDEALLHIEKDKLYPPRYIISISSANAQRNDTLVLQFRGSLDAFETEVMLELVSYMSTTFFMLTLKIYRYPP